MTMSCHPFTQQHPLFPRKVSPSPGSPDYARTTRKRKLSPPNITKSCWRSRFTLPPGSTLPTVLMRCGFWWTTIRGAGYFHFVISFCHLFSAAGFWLVLPLDFLWGLQQRNTGTTRHNTLTSNTYNNPWPPRSNLYFRFVFWNYASLCFCSVLLTKTVQSTRNRIQH